MILIEKIEYKKNKQKIGIVTRAILTVSRELYYFLYKKSLGG